MLVGGGGKAYGCPSIVFTDIVVFSLPKLKLL